MHRDSFILKKKQVAHAYYNGLQSVLVKFKKIPTMYKSIFDLLRRAGAQGAFRVCICMCVRTCAHACTSVYKVIREINTLELRKRQNRVLGVNVLFEFF